MHRGPKYGHGICTERQFQIARRTADHTLRTLFRLLLCKERSDLGAWTNRIHPLQMQHVFDSQNNNLPQ